MEVSSAVLWAETRVAAATRERAIREDLGSMVGTMRDGRRSEDRWENEGRSGTRLGGLCEMGAQGRWVSRCGEGDQCIWRMEKPSSAPLEPREGISGLACTQPHDLLHCLLSSPL